MAVPEEIDDPGFVLPVAISHINLRELLQDLWYWKQHCHSPDPLAGLDIIHPRYALGAGGKLTKTLRVR